MPNISGSRAPRGSETQGRDGGGFPWLSLLPILSIPAFPVAVLAVGWDAAGGVLLAIIAFGTVALVEIAWMGAEEIRPPRR